jgi:hypothetical protein
MMEHCATTPPSVASELDVGGAFVQVQGTPFTSRLRGGMPNRWSGNFTGITEVSILAAELRDMHFFPSPVTWRTSFAGII